MPHLHQSIGFHLAAPPRRNCRDVCCCCLPACTFWGWFKFLLIIATIFIFMPIGLGYLHKAWIWSADYIRYRHGVIDKVEPPWFYTYPCLICDTMDCKVDATQVIRHYGDYSVGFSIDLCHVLLGWQYEMVIVFLGLIVYLIWLACSWCCCGRGRRRPVYSVLIEK